LAALSAFLRRKQRLWMRSLIDAPYASEWSAPRRVGSPCENALTKNPKTKNAAFCTCTPVKPSFKLAAWLPPSRAPSLLARRGGWNVTVPPLRLSGGSPDSRSGDTKEAWVRSEAALASQVSDERKHLLRSSTC